jgi:imidazolonepropionase-like amidohydrolase
MQQESYRYPSRMTVPVAITHATVVPMDTERLLFDQTILIEDGYITALAPSSSVPVESFFTVVDGAGKYVIPGLADMHVHYWSPGDAPLFLAHGVTRVRNMSGAPFHLALQQQVERGETPGPRIITTSPIIEGDSFLLPLWYRATHAVDAERIVRECVQRGYEQIKVYNALTSDTLHALGQAAVTFHVRLTGHCPNVMTFEEAIDAGMSCFEHLVGIWRGHLKDGMEQRSDQSNLDLDVVLMAAHHLDFDALRHLAQQMAAKQIWNCPTLVALQWMHEAQTIGVTDPSLQPWLKYVPSLAKQVWKQIDPGQYRPQYEQWLDAWHARNDIFSRIVSLLHREGAPLLVGTDTPVRFVIQGLSVHQELANLVQAGLSPFEALSCGTREAARFLDQVDQWGTVTVGKRADLLLVRANPLQDVAAVRDLEAVFANGFHLPRTDLDALLTQQEEVAALYPPRSLPPVTVRAMEDDGTVVGQGTWLEQIYGIESGRLVYKHAQVPDGDWLIEEQYAFERGDIFSVGGGQRYTTSLRLTPALTLRHATCVAESFVGAERCEVTWSDHGEYIIRRKEVDGHELVVTIRTHPLLPSETLSPTVLILFLGRQAPIPKEQKILSVDAHEVRVLTMTVTAVAARGQSEGGGDRTWQIGIERPEKTTRQIYHLTAEGQFLQMEEDVRLLIPM